MVSDMAWLVWTGHVVRAKSVGPKSTEAVMPFRFFLLLVVVVLILSGLTVWMASTAGGWALLPAMAAVALVLSVLIRRTG